MAVRKKAEWRIRLCLRSPGIKSMNLTQRCADYKTAQCVFDRLERLNAVIGENIELREVVMTHKNVVISRRKGQVTATDETALANAIGKSSENVTVPLATV